MAAIVLRADRWQVHHLGTQVPQPDLLDIVGTLRADLVVLSLTNDQALATAREMADAVRATTGAEVLIGGPGSTLSHLVSVAREIS